MQIIHSLSIVCFGVEIFFPFFLMQAMKSYPGPSLLTRRACCVASMPDSRSACPTLVLSGQSLAHIQILLLDDKNRYERIGEGCETSHPACARFLMRLMWQHIFVLERYGEDEVLIAGGPRI